MSFGSLLCKLWRWFANLFEKVLDLVLNAVRTIAGVLMDVLDDVFSSSSGGFLKLLIIGAAAWWLLSGDDEKEAKKDDESVAGMASGAAMAYYNPYAYGASKAMEMV